MKTLIPFAAILSLAGVIGLTIRQEASATPTPESVSTPPIQAEGCLCGCVTGSPCTCLNCPEANAGIAAAIADLSARLEALESKPETLAVVPEPPEVDVQGIMQDFREAFPYEPDPVDVPTTHDGNGYLLSSAIQAWLAQHSGGQGWSYSGGDYGAPLRNHLIRSHGWRESQLLGLSDSQLRELHSASHNGRLRPRSDVDNLTIAMTSASDEGVPVYYDTSDDYWYWTWEGRRYRWHTLEEGRTYGGKFVYSNGRMCWNGTESAPVTVTRTTTYTAPVRISSSGSSCPNGRCPLPSTNYRRRGRW